MNRIMVLMVVLIGVLGCTKDSSSSNQPQQQNNKKVVITPDTVWTDIIPSAWVDKNGGHYAVSDTGMYYYAVAGNGSLDGVEYWLGWTVNEGQPGSYNYWFGMDRDAVIYGNSIMFEGLNSVTGACVLEVRVVNVMSDVLLRGYYY